METDKLVSIIIPVYNVEQYLDECIESVLKQTHENLEIILVDDGSTDSSTYICDKYHESDHRIKVIHKTNGGLADSRNIALDCAKGDYISFVDSDDWVSPDMIKVLFDACEQYSADIAVCGLRRMYCDGAEDFCPKSQKLFSTNDALTALFRGVEFGDQACTKLFKRELFDAVRYPKGRQFEDVFTTYKLFLRASNIVTIPDPLYYYRQRRSSITGAKFNPKKMDLIDAISSIQNESIIKVNSNWNDILEIRVLDAVCWTLIDIYISDENETFEDMALQMYRTIRLSMWKIIRNSQYRSCKLLAYLSPIGYYGVKTVISSKVVKKMIQDQHTFYD